MAAHAVVGAADDRAGGADVAGVAHTHGAVAHGSRAAAGRAERASSRCQSTPREWRATATRARPLQSWKHGRAGWHDVPVQSRMG